MSLEEISDYAKVILMGLPAVWKLMMTNFRKLKAVKFLESQVTEVKL
jgi:hypothetical protein